MQGTLSERSLVELLHEIIVRKLSGALRLQRERVQAVIYAEGGGLVGVATNLRAMRLGECVQRWQIFAGAQSSQAAYTISHLSTDASDADYGARLVAEGLLDESQLRELQSRQMDETLRLLLAWGDGEWKFDSRARVVAHLSIEFDSRALILDAARKLTPERAAVRVADDSEIIKPEAEGRDNSWSNLQPAEAFVLSRVEASMSIGELLAICGLPEAAARPAVYTLILGGLLERQHQPCALTTTTPHAVHAPQIETEKPTADSFIKSSIKSSPGASPPGATKIKETDEERKKSLLARGNAVNHYLMLGVSRSVNQATVKTAYYALARRFHPDTFPNISDAAERAALEAAFARISQAYELLKNEQARLAYDRNLDGASTPLTPQTSPTPPPRPTSQVPTPTAKANPISGATNETPSDSFSPAPQTSSSYQSEEDFQHGLTALKAGNMVLALTRFSDAVRRAPDQARYRAQLGSLLARERRTRHAAEAELRAAVTLEPSNTDYRITLAEFYRDIGHARRAIGELERALAQQPRDARLRRALTDFQKAGKPSAK